MNILIVDVETTYQKADGRTDPTPYHTDNKLVSVGFKGVDKCIEDYLFFNHVNFDRMDNREVTDSLQDILDESELIIGHNLKFDFSWLFETGFKYSGKFYDTMIFQYVVNKGQKQGLSLGDCCERYNLTPKKDILKDYMKQGINVDAIPAAELEEYGRSDVQSTYELYLRQQELIANSPEIQSMMPVIEMSMQALPVLIQMERDGIYIDAVTLAEVETEYKKERDILEKVMNDMVVEVMGQRPINLNSPEHLSWVIYSRKVNDKHQWANLFNIGTELRGSVVKRKYPRSYKKSQFQDIVVKNMTTLKRQDAVHCLQCERGLIRKVKKSGEPFKNFSKCSACEGAAFTYEDRTEVAGFKVQPLGSIYATSAGFATDKQTIDDLVKGGKLKGPAKEFLESLKRKNAIETYLSTFVEGIQRNIRNDGLLHTSFNQCVTATGRLSSSGPNFQNLPRGKTFPIRKVITSRFEGGSILESDFAQLEFRAAAMLSKCPVALKDILNNVDIHEYSAKVMTDAGQPTDRQAAKAHTFKPLYGGLSGTDAEITYYNAFLEKYSGIKQWHEELVSKACGFKQIQIPSGRIYAFPNARRMADRVVGKTQIVNYPVQGFATADITWVVLIDIYEKMQKLGLKSKIILQIHDSIVADTHPEEKDIMIQIFKESFTDADKLLKKWFNFETDVPIGYEMAIGKNLMIKEKI